MCSSSCIQTVLIQKVTRRRRRYCIMLLLLLYVELVEKRAVVVDKLQDFELTIDPILTVLGLPEVTKHLEESGK